MRVSVPQFYSLDATVDDVLKVPVTLLLLSSLTVDHCTLVLAQLVIEKPAWRCHGYQNQLFVQVLPLLDSQ